MNINDRELLARTLQAEAGNQGYGGMLAAGSVIMNRANASGYGDGLRGVILKPGQFSAWNSTTGYAGGEQGQDMANMRASDEAYKAADALISGGYEDVTGGATHYYNPAISQPKWGQKAGGDWKQIGDHVFGFADAGKKPNLNQAIASDTMRVLGKQPKGLLAVPEETNNTESKMIPEEKPKGLLGSLGIQKMVEGAEGEAGQRFFQRDTFKDTAARMAPLLAAMGSSPALQKATAGIAAQRTEKNARNKSLEFLSQMPGGEEFVRIAEVAGPKAAMQAYLESRKAPKDTSTSAMKNYSEYQRLLAEEGPEAAKQFLSTIKSGGVTVNTGDSSLYGKAPEGSVWAKDADGQHIMEETAPGSGKFRPSVLMLEGSNPEKRAAELAEKERKRIVNADSAFDAITLIDDIYKDPALPSVTGMIQGRAPALSQDGTDLVVKIDQLKGKAFLQAFETLKGGGQITEREGLAATKAIARLERQQSPEAYRESLMALRSVVERVRKRALGQEIPEYSDEEFKALYSSLGVSSPDSSQQKTKTGVTYKVIGGSGG